MKYKDIINDSKIKQIFSKIDEKHDSEMNHGLQHAIKVVENITKLGNLLKVDKETMENLKIAGYLHDIGHSYTNKDHQVESTLYASKYLEDKIDKDSYTKIIEAIKKHHEKQKTNDLSLFEHIVLFADKMDFSHTRLDKNYIELHNDNYFIENDIINIDFDIKDNIFIIIIETNNIDIKKLSKWNYYPKIIKRIEEFSNKINIKNKIKIIKK